jgi:GT2 family glycosyltransferase
MNINSERKDYMFPSVTIVILNWNGWKDTIECLESLYRITYPKYQVIIIDNGSTDNSIERITEYCRGNLQLTSRFFTYDPSWKPLEMISYSREESEKISFGESEVFQQFSHRKLVLIMNGENEGFGKGNNVGIKYAMDVLRTDYILLLNNDTVVDPAFLSQMVKVAESHPDTGIIGSKIFYYDYNGKTDVIWEEGGGITDPLSSSGYILSAPLVRSDPDNPVVELQFICGCVFLISTMVLKKLSPAGFNPAYFCYYEDADLSLKCIKLGFKCYYAPKSIVWHKWSSSAGGRYSPFCIFHEIRSRVIFIKTNGTQLKFMLFLLKSIIIDQFLFIFSIMFRIKKPSLLRNYYAGFIDGVLYRPEKNGIKS